MTLSIQTDRALIRSAGRSTRYVLVSIDAPPAERRETRPAVNISLVLDRSGSMAGAKLALVKEAGEHVLRLLSPTDRFSLVVYDDVVDVVAPSSFATPDAVRRALDALARVEEGGRTDLCGGWMRGCEQIALVLAKEQVNRCLLLTDGLANNGVTSHDELVRIAGDLAGRGVQTTTFGVGTDFDERLLRDMADAGQGHFYFIEKPRQIPDLLASEVGEALDVVARHAILRVVLPRGACAQSLNCYHQVTVEGDNELHVQLGDLVSTQHIEVAIKLVMPEGTPGESITAELWLADAEGVLGNSRHEARWIFAGHSENDRQPRNRIVDRAVAWLYAARARASATEYNRRGHYEHAQYVLTTTAKRIRSYAGDDAELNRIADELLRDLEMFEAPMSLGDRKAAFFGAMTSLAGRDFIGRARRGPLT